jgi:hypothetical protein
MSKGTETMEAKHTPGPWTIVDREVLEDGGVYPRHIVGGSRELEICWLESLFSAESAVKNPDSIASSDKMMESATDTRSKSANAHLIATAPDMLAALKAMLALRPLSSGESNGLLNEACALAEAAVAKAEGRAS